MGLHKSNYRSGHLILASCQILRKPGWLISPFSMNKKRSRMRRTTNAHYVSKAYLGGHTTLCNVAPRHPGRTRHGRTFLRDCMHAHARWGSFCGAMCQEYAYRSGSCSAWWEFLQETGMNSGGFPVDIIRSPWFWDNCSITLYLTMTSKSVATCIKRQSRHYSETFPICSRSERFD